MKPKHCPDQDVGTEVKLVVLADEERDPGHILDLVLLREHIALIVVKKARDGNNASDVGKTRRVDS